MSHFLPDPPLLLEISRRWVRLCAPGGVPLTAALDPDTFAWDSALDSAEQLVRKLRPKKAALSIVLADAWLRYFVIDWPRQKLSAQEAQAFAAQAFTQIYEQASRDWLVTTVPTGRSGKRLLCAMDRPAVAALDRFLQRCGWSAERLTGAFAAGLDLAAPTLVGGTGYFVYSHDDQAHCARIEGGALTRMRSQVMPDKAAQTRMALVKRFAAAASAETAGTASSAGASIDTIYALLVDCDPADFPATAARNVRRELLAIRRHPNRFLAEIGRQWLAA